MEQERLTRSEHGARPGEQEGIEVEVWEPNKQEQERQALLDDANNTREGNASSQLTARDLVHSYRDLISTDNVDTNGDRQEYY